MFPDEHMAWWIVQYGYWIVFTVNFFQGFGLPLPGETLLMAASIYAGTSQSLDIHFLVLVTAALVLLNDVLGYVMGRYFGFRWLLKYGERVGLNERRVRLGQYLFLRYGMSFVFFVHFMPFLRGLVGFLAGSNRMPVARYMAGAVVGDAVWVGIFGYGAFWLGQTAHHLIGAVQILIFAAAAMVVVAALIFFRRHETRLMDEAERTLPGPILPDRMLLK